MSDLSGNPLTWSVGSSSGFDYANAYVSAVPELPGSSMLLAGRCVLIGCLRRRARRAD